MTVVKSFITLSTGDECRYTKCRYDECRGTIETHKHPKTKETPATDFRL
jgi:hypothetical protein